MFAMTTRNGVNVTGSPGSVLVRVSVSFESGQGRAPAVQAGGSGELHKEGWTMADDTDAKGRRLNWQSSRLDTLWGSTLRRLAGLENNSGSKNATKAFYQSAANLFVVLVVAVAFALYYVFSAFLRPLLWAVLCGTFLFPIKRRASRSLLSWLRLLQANNTPICLGVWFLPLRVVKSGVAKVETLLEEQWRYFVWMAVVLGGTYGVTHFTFCSRLATAVDGFLEICRYGVVLLQKHELGLYVRLCKLW